MKAVRTREESLHDLQRRRWCTAASLESIKKKLTRMNHTKVFVDHFMQGHARFGCKIAHEQSTIAVFKRKCTKNWLTLKFRGLAEYCEKGMVCSVRRANYEEMLRWVRALLVISRRSSSLQKTDGLRNPLDFPAIASLPHSHINLHEDSRPPPVPPTTQSWWPIRTGRASPAIVEVPPVCWISRIRLQRNASADAPAKDNEWIRDEDYVSPPNPDSQRPPAAGQINTGEHGSGRLCFFFF
ncbi:hypothetical protein DEU56DRAFT_915258 [Suillus clintonianus]|uniref:uncharacterized protein n=1 Tax=Suillus clintonianus TaxID=1904413 RepID=UPI001B864D24|nr:uncharacterized protein DEU56DRAFT_915258 [Suillus clintonianus]KAG2129136.1 hypothetical protein DEU56DRAFT_915258 [Suillus clintonianus]